MAQPPPDLSDRDQADLAALADGSLPAARRAEVEERVAASPVLQDALAQQRAALTALRALESERAPDRLRQSLLEEEGAGRPHTAAASRRGTRPLRPRLLAGLAVAATAAAVALVLVLPSGPSDAEALAAVAVKAPQERVAGTVNAEVDGIRFPNWQQQTHWKPVGLRADEVDGRDTATVIYESYGNTVAYTIRARPALDLPGGDGPYRAFEYEGRPALMWLRGGRTCLLVGSEGVAQDTLRKLAYATKYY